MNKFILLKIKQAHVTFTYLTLYFNIPREKSEIDTVRTVRNQIYGHRATAATSDVDILNHWGAVETSIKAIAHSCNDVDFENHVTKYIDSVKNGPLDIESIIQVLKQWSENEGIIQSKVDGVNETLDDVSATVKGT